MFYKINDYKIKTFFYPKVKNLIKTENICENAINCVYNINNLVNVFEYIIKNVFIKVNNYFISKVNFIYTASPLPCPNTNSRPIIRISKQIYLCLIRT